VNREFILVLSIITGILAVTRVVRLVVDDAWPPMEKARKAYARRASDEWLPLIECPWCVAPYVALPAVAWFALTFRFPTWTVNNWAWWIVNGWAAVSWLAAYLTLRDIPPESRE
jgi:hypothetical protein